MADSKLTLGYWGFQGLSETSRYILEYCGLEYNQKLYTLPEEWLKDKQSGFMDFPNLPYILDGDVKIS